MKRQRAICILGMHRSGTSVVARAVNLLGVYLGSDEDLFPPALANRMGFWERRDVAVLQNKMFSLLRANWHTCLHIDPEWHRSEEIKPLRDELVSLIEKNFSGQPIWGWKDPRTCIFLPLWVDVLKEMRIDLSCVYVYRNPLDVAKSHHKRDGFPYDKSFGLWFYYNMTALMASSSMNRYIISYDRFIDDWEPELRKCVAHLGVTWPEDDSELIGEMKRFVKPELRHSVSLAKDLRELRVPPAAARLYSALEAAAQDLSSTETLEKSVAGLSEEFRSYVDFFKHEYRQSVSLKQEIRDLTHRLHELQAAAPPSDDRDLESRRPKDEGRADRNILGRFGRYAGWIRRKFHKERATDISLLSDDPLYGKWMVQNEPDSFCLKMLKKESTAWSYRPRISIVTAFSNPDRLSLIQCVESVLSQVYDRWEWCLVAGGSAESRIGEVVREYAGRETRIRFLSLPESRGGTELSNEGLKLATGDYVAFLDAEDTLAPFALFEVVKLLNQDRNIDFIFSDEDRIPVDGERRYDPFFKPGWAPDTFLSYNYLRHFAVIRRSLVEKAGGFREGYDGAQDYDLFLRIVQNTNRIQRVPKVLYHWRSGAGSTADTPTAEPKVLDASKKAIHDFLKVNGLEGDVIDGLIPTAYRVRYKVRPDQRVCIIIPTLDKVHLLSQCVDSILERTEYRNYEILVVDNKSREEETFRYFDLVEKEKKARIIQYNKPFNYSDINNYAVRQTDSELLLFLNNDTEVIGGEWLSAMLEFAQRNDVGAVGAKLLYPDRTIQHAGVVIGIGRYADHVHKYFPEASPGNMGRINVIQNLSAVTGACMMMRRKVFEEVGGFDETFAYAFNDIDLCLRVRQKGYLVVYTPFAVLYHHESVTRGQDDTPEKKERGLREAKLLRTRWDAVFVSGDPYYNPNLTLATRDYAIKR